MEKKNNMYKLSVSQWSPFAGCKHDCIYCKSSFQRQLKRWAKKKCPSCYEFVPHAHHERLDQSLPNTGHMQFIFTCSSGDMRYLGTPYLFLCCNSVGEGLELQHGTVGKSCGS